MTYFVMSVDLSTELKTYLFHLAYPLWDVNTSFFAKRISVNEKRLKTDYQFYGLSWKFKFQAQLNLVIFDFFASHIWPFDKSFHRHSTLKKSLN